MSDELQDALTSASVDPMDTLKSDLGMTDAVKSEPKQEAKPEAKEPKAEPKEESEPESKSSENEEADDTATPKKEHIRSPESTKISRQAAANRGLLKTNNELKAKLAEFEKAKSEEPQENSPNKPNIDDFDSYDEYEKAQSKYSDELLDYNVEKRIEERDQQRNFEKSEADQEVKVQEMRSAFEERETQFKASHKNYDRNAQALVDTLDYLPEESAQGGQAMREYLAKSDVAPELIHHLGQNLEIVEDLTSRDLVGFIEGMYDLKNSLVKNPSERKRLPEPIDKLKSSNEGGKSMVDMSWKEMRKHMKT